MMLLILYTISTKMQELTIEIKELTVSVEELTIEELENLEYLNLDKWDENDMAIDSLEGIELAKNLQYLNKLMGNPMLIHENASVLRGRI